MEMFKCNRNKINNNLFYLNVDFQNQKCKYLKTMNQTKEVTFINESVDENL